MSATILIPAVLFLATLIRSAFGFGEALIAVPCSPCLIPVEIAAPVAVLVSVTVALLILLQDWSKVHLRSAVRLVLPTLPGIPARAARFLKTLCPNRSSKRYSRS